MTMNPNRWVNTLPFTNTKVNQEKYKLDSSRWVNTLPGKEESTLILSNAINSNLNSESNWNKKYSLTLIAFVVGLILVVVIKNETRHLQREISNLRASINIVKHELHQTILDHEVITSPANISGLAKENLESDFIFYKKFQIKELDKKKEKIITSLEKTKNKSSKNKIKLEVAKKIEQKRTELVKLRELYYQPKKLPGEIKLQVTKKIETTKDELKKLYSDPKDSIDLEKVYRWGAIQVVKVVLGMPIVPGR